MNHSQIGGTIALRQDVIQSETGSSCSFEAESLYHFKQEVIAVGTSKYNPLYTSE